jgi:hypothetical protein
VQNAIHKWFTALRIVPGTILRTFATFSNHRLGVFVPFVGLLLLLAGVLWFINAIAPLAPFVYSLF